MDTENPQKNNFKSFFKIGQEIFYAIHPDRKKIPFSIPEEDKKHVGEIQKLVVSWETARAVGTTNGMTFAKWPESYFGDKLRGPFTSEQKCKDYLSKALPAFDHEGHLSK